MLTIDEAINFQKEQIEKTYKDADSSYLFEDEQAYLTEQAAKQEEVLEYLCECKELS